MSSTEFLEGLKNEFPGAITKIDIGYGQKFAEFSSNAAASIFNVCSTNERGRFDLLEDLLAYDSGDDIVLVYNLYSTLLNHRVILKTSLHRKEPSILTATTVWLAALSYEKEIAELFGVRFKNHTTEIPFLLPKDWQGFPMRKDYVYPGGYSGIAHGSGVERRKR